MTSYWKGAALGLVICVAGSAVWVKGWGTSGHERAPALVFEPAFVDVSEAWILPGASRGFTVLLRNLSASDARLEELRFSCPCASGAIVGSERFPVRVPPRAAVPVKVTVTSRKGERGPVELRFGVVGHIDDQPIEAGAHAAMRFVQHLNAEPPFLAFGTINAGDGEHSEFLELWFPEDGEPPHVELTAESDDPCVSAHLDRFASPRSSNDGADRMMIVGRLAVTVDPKIAPERLKAHVIVRSGDKELRVPVLAFIERPSVEVQNE